MGSDGRFLVQWFNESSRHSGIHSSRTPYGDRRCGCGRVGIVAPLAAEGSRPYDTLFADSIGQYLPAGQSIERFTLNVGDGESLPRGVQLGDFDGAWLSGSPLNVYRLEQPTVRAQLDLARAIWGAGVPAFGSCWGLQLMTAAPAAPVLGSTALPNSGATTMQFGHSRKTHCVTDVEAAACLAALAVHCQRVPDRGLQRRSCCRAGAQAAHLLGRH